MSDRWNGIPDNPERAGWHWVGYPNWAEPKFWCSRGYWQGCRPEWLTDYAQYLGPIEPPKVTYQA
jgi:hypothetical protein